MILNRTVSHLKAGLPFIFFTAYRDYLPAHILESQRKTAEGIPSTLALAKMYHRDHLQDIRQEFVRNTHNLGDAATEEWRKGLEPRGKAAMADALRWEKWQGPTPSPDPGQVLRNYDPSSFPRREARRSGDVGKYEPSPVTTNGKPTFLLSLIVYLHVLCLISSSLSHETILA